jgi:hypothetical protein
MTGAPGRLGGRFNAHGCPTSHPSRKNAYGCGTQACGAAYRKVRVGHPPLLAPIEEGRPQGESVVEAIAKLAVDLAGIVEVEAAKGEAVIRQHPAVCHVGCRDRCRDVLAETLSKCEIE